MSTETDVLAGAVQDLMVGVRLRSQGTDPRQAIDQYEALLRTANAHPRDAITLHLLVAQIHVQTGQQRAALRSFGTAVSIAARQHHFGVFNEHGGPVVRHLLDNATDRDLCLTLPEELALVAWLRESAHAPSDIRAVAPPASSASVAPPAPVEPLTPRELQLIELISLGLSNQQIADRTTLSVTTVKWHLYNLYGKLSVKNRSAALARARSLQLLRA